MLIKNTRELINPTNFKWKVLVYGLPGGGKTEWASGAMNPGIAACESGHGKGLLSVASKGLDYIEPENTGDLDQFCSGLLFKDKDTLVLDSLSEMCRTFIKDAALAIPRAKGQSPKRSKGVPELDDYGTMGIMTQKYMRRLLAQDKHIVVTAGLKIEKPDADTGRGSFLLGPDLSGQMFLGSAAMFDTVLSLKTRQKFKNPKDAKTKFVEHYFLTEQDGMNIAKCRCNIDPKTALLDSEEVFDIKTGQGSWQFLFDKIIAKYTEAYKEVKSG